MNSQIVEVAPSDISDTIKNSQINLIHKSSATGEVGGTGFNAEDVSAESSTSSHQLDIESRFGKDGGQHLVQKARRGEFVETDKVLKEAADLCKSDPDLKKRVELAEKEQEEIIQQQMDVIYNKRVVYCIFLVVFIANILINIDHGALPGCYEQIMTKLEINKLQYGVLGSFVFAGLTLGSIVSTALYSKGEMIKPVLLGSILMNTISLLLFTTTKSYYFSLFLRGATGFFQIFLVVYQPVWTDTFCEEKFKSIALTINMLAAPLGIVGGYLLTYYMNKFRTWEWAFYLQSFAILPCFIFLLLVPEKYLNVESTVHTRKKIQKNVGADVLSRLSKGSQSSSQGSNTSIDEDDSINIDQNINSSLQIQEENKCNLDKSQSTTSTLTGDQLVKRAIIYNLKKKEKNMNGFQQEGQENLSQKVQSMITNSVFCGLVATMSGLYFVVTGIQYWITAYMMNVLGANAELAALYFVILCFSGPIMGVIAGGIFTQCVGGYNSTRGQLLQCIVGVLACLSGIPVPFFNNVHFMAMFVWLLLFFGGFITPQVIGIMLNSVEENKRISANSLAQLAFNLIGYLPAPTFYGFIAQISGNEASRIPMACLLFTTIFTVSALIFSIQRKLENEEKSTVLQRLLRSKKYNKEQEGDERNEFDSSKKDKLLLKNTQRDQ